MYMLSPFFLFNWCHESWWGMLVNLEKIAGRCFSFSHFWVAGKKMLKLLGKNRKAAIKAKLWLEYFSLLHHIILREACYTCLLVGQLRNFVLGQHHRSPSSGPLKFATCRGNLHDIRICFMLPMSFIILPIYSIFLEKKRAKIYFYFSFGLKRKTTTANRLPSHIQQGKNLIPIYHNS